MAYGKEQTRNVVDVYEKDVNRSNANWGEKLE